MLGTAALVYWVNNLTAGVAIATWLIYVGAYTPLKTTLAAQHGGRRRERALPILIGWTAAGAAIDMRAWALAGGDVSLAVSAFHGDRLAISRRLPARRPADADGR